MSVFLRLARLMWPFRWWLVVSVLLGFATVGTGVGLMAASAYLISRAALATSVADLSVIIALVQLFAISRAALRYVERYVTHSTTFRILTRLRAWLYASLEPLAPARLLSSRGGDVLARLMADVETLELFYARTLVPPVVAALVTLLACCILGIFNLWLGIALLIFLALTGVALPLTTRGLSREPMAEMVATRALLSATLVDEMQGLADLVACNQEVYFQERVLRLSGHLSGVQERIARVRGLGIALGALLSGLAGLTVLGLAIPLVSGGQISGVYLALLPLTAMASFEAVQPLSLAMQNLQASGSAANRLFEFIDAEPVVQEMESPECRPRESRHDYSLEVRHLRFGYLPDEAPVLNDISFAVPAGGRLLIIGPSGAGKTTLVNLLLRFWDYQAGSIKLADRELRDYHPDDVRALISVVAQETYLFGGTIRDNLLLADPEAGEQEMVDACRQAELHDFITGLPDGYDTGIGENGFLLSGGERQRLAIARAILKNAPILVLDEATAHLDAVTETSVLRALQQLMRGRTTLIIAHRSIGLEPVDQVLTLNEGRIRQEKS